MKDFELKKTQILDRIDIVDLVSEHVALKRSGRRWVGLCPFHNEKTPSFTVSPERAAFKCFGCGKGGDVFTFVQDRENVTFIEAMQMLADRAGLDLAFETSGQSGKISRTDLARVNEWAMRFFRSVLLDASVGKDVREYLVQRNVQEDTSELFGLGLATQNGPALLQSAAHAGFGEPLLLEADLIRKDEQDRLYLTFRERLMFPIRDATKRVIGFGGRTMIDDKAKYLNTRQNLLFDKGRGLYGIDLARSRMTELGRAVLVEGYTDCIAAHQAGFAETVATLGTALTEAQISLVRRYCDQIILLFDSDSAGEAAADRAIHVSLPRHVTVRLARIPEGKDPCDFLTNKSPEAFSAVLDESIDALEFKWSNAKRHYDSDNSDAARREAILDFIGLIAEACRSGAVDAIERGLIANRVAKLVGLESRDVHDLMVRAGKKRPYHQAGLSSKNAGPSVSSPQSAEQAAWADLLSVLLNEPGLLSLIGDAPPVDRITHDRDRRIAEVVLAMASEFGEFRIAEVLARCHDPADARRVIELAQCGADRGNYRASLEVALERIRSGFQTSELESARRRLLDSDGGGNDSAAATSALEEIHGNLMNRRHFASRRKIRQHTQIEVPGGVENSGNE